jgi:hypothetical protein
VSAQPYFAAAGVASILSGAALAAVEWKGMQVVGWGCAAAMGACVAAPAALDRRAAAAAACDTGGGREEEAASNMGGGGSDGGGVDAGGAENKV